MWRVSGAELKGLRDSFMKGFMKLPGGEGEAVSNRLLKSSEWYFPLLPHTELSSSL